MLWSPFTGLICKALQWDHICCWSTSCLWQKGRKIIERTKIKPCNTRLGPKTRRLNTGEWWPNTQYVNMTLCPVISQSGYETHAGFATHFALLAGLFLLSWGNTLLSQVNHKATEETEAWQEPLELGLLELPWPSPAHGSSSCTGLLWASPSLTMSQYRDSTASLGLCSNVWPALWGTGSSYHSPGISHLPHCAHCPLSKLWEGPGSISALEFAGLDEVPDGSFLRLKLSGLLSGYLLFLIMGEEPRLMMCFNTKSQIMATGNASKWRYMLHVVRYTQF